MIALSILSVLLATSALAAPARRADTFRGACDIPTSVFATDLPPAFGPPQSPPTMVQVGVGLQNYTCNSNGTFDFDGVRATMYDMSCAVNTPAYSTLPNDTFNDWAASPSFDPFDQAFAQQMKDRHNITQVGVYFFVIQNGSPAPMWDMRFGGPFGGDQNAFVIAKKDTSIPSPDGPQNVDWVALEKTSGGLANNIFRVETVNGQPPSSCTPGNTTTVKYSAKYYFV